MKSNSSLLGDNVLKDKLACNAVTQSGYGSVKFLLLHFILIASNDVPADIAADVDMSGVSSWLLSFGFANNGTK
jgi:hypothetical protein